MHDEIDYFVGITPLIVIPGYQLHKIVVESDTCYCIENGCTSIAEEVCRYAIIFSVSEITLLFFFISLFLCCLIIIIRFRFFQAAGISLVSEAGLCLYIFEAWNFLALICVINC